MFLLPFNLSGLESAKKIEFKNIEAVLIVTCVQLFVILLCFSLENNVSGTVEGKPFGITTYVYIFILKSDFIFVSNVYKK